MFWSQSGQSWALQLASFSGILAFLVLLGFSRLFVGENAFELQEPEKTFESFAPMLPTPAEPTPTEQPTAEQPTPAQQATPAEQLEAERKENIWKRRITVLLNFL
jgi:hypothetical protein